MASFEFLMMTYGKLGQNILALVILCLLSSYCVKMYSLLITLYARTYIFISIKYFYFEE